MRDSDIRIVDASVEYRDVELAQPLTLANGSISEFTVAYVELTVEDRTGRRAVGTGASTLSIPWSWPRGSTSLQQRDAYLRSVVVSLVERTQQAGAHDPFEHWHELTSGLDAFATDSEAGLVPMLALDLALGAVDNAIHDSWARAAGRPALDLYDAEHLNSDVAEWLGTRFSGIWPGDGRGAPRNRLPVQHVVGVADPIAASAASGEGVVGRPLDEWVRLDRFDSVKVKLAGADPKADAARVAEIAQLMSRYSQTFELALDANEGYPDVAGVVDFLDSLRATAPDVMKRVTYVEQPISREQAPDPDAMAAVREQVPVIIDEGLAEVRQLAELGNEGWSGLVVKAAKGQSFAMLCQTFASRSGMFLAVQDLTATDVALEHSARLAAALPVSSLGFEYNSRQYAPSANDELAERRRDLVTTTDGAVYVGEATAGIY